MSGTSGSGESGRGYAFEGFRLDLHARQVFGPDAVPVPLTAKALDVLVYLIEHRDRVVDKDELLAQVWAGRVVEENNLTQAVSALRHAFGAGVGDRRYIVTVPGHGYRFVAEVAAVDGGRRNRRAAQFRQRPAGGERRPSPGWPSPCFCPLSRSGGRDPRGRRPSPRMMPRWRSCRSARSRPGLATSCWSWGWPRR